MSFADLKKARQKTLEKLQGAADKITTGGKSFEDTRFWKPTIDKSGNGYAVIRFLPTPDKDALPWVRYWDHGFQGPTGKWYIEKSLTSIGQDDPIGQLNSKLWNTGREEDKETVRKRKRRLHYVSNILVVTDPGNPDNEGKVFLYQYGKKIFDKIIDVMQPAFEDETPINPFDLWDGANFKLKIRKVEGYRNYDKSEFDKPSQVAGGDEEQQKEIYEQLFSLEEFIDPSKYKSYDELQKRLVDVLGSEALQLSTREQNELEDTVEAEEPESVESQSESSDDEGVDMSYFEKIAQED